MIVFSNSSNFSSCMSSKRISDGGNVSSSMLSLILWFIFSSIDDGCCCGSFLTDNSSSVVASVAGVGVCLSSCSRDVIAEDVLAFTFSRGILILLSLYMTFMLAGEIL